MDISQRQLATTIRIERIGEMIEMAIPDQRYIDYMGDPNVGVNYQTERQRNRLQQGNAVHYVDPNTLTHITMPITRVFTSAGEISLTFWTNGHANEITGIQYDGVTHAGGTWHFPSDG